MNYLETENGVVVAGSEMKAIEMEMGDEVHFYLQSDTRLQLSGTIVAIQPPIIKVDSYSGDAILVSFHKDNQIGGLPALPIPQIRDVTREYSHAPICIHLSQRVIPVEIQDYEPYVKPG